MTELGRYMKDMDRTDVFYAKHAGWNCLFGFGRIPLDTTYVMDGSWLVTTALCGASIKTLMPLAGSRSCSFFLCVGVVVCGFEMYRRPHVSDIITFRL